ncbi:hypothetical protein N9M69_02950 [Flavobacteriaceae bacterium]|nr:hypothetical protein [Flavobacteriaceae bacterium]
MRNLHRIIITALILLSSCSPKILTNLSKSYALLDYKQKVEVLGLTELEPDNAEVLGEVKIIDTGFSINCGYDVVLDKARLEARKVGGNIIKITEHEPPSIFGSSCHRIKARILKIEDIDKYTPKLEEDALLDVDYAILNIYRFRGAGALVGYDLHLGDSVICRVKNNFKTTIHIKKDGLNTLWARTEVKSEVPIDVKMGKTYYLRCGITIGGFVGRPKLQLVDSKTGKTEFESFKAKNK